VFCSDVRIVPGQVLIIPALGNLPQQWVALAGRPQFMHVTVRCGKLHSCCLQWLLTHPPASCCFLPMWCRGQLPFPMAPTEQACVYPCSNCAHHLCCMHAVAPAPDNLEGAITLLQTLLKAADNYGAVSLAMPLLRWTRLL
jgi:hypothetical protein